MESCCTLHRAPTIPQTPCSSHALCCYTSRPAPSSALAASLMRYIVLQHWIAFQLLHALAQCHERGICHGDIKCENVLVTSWDWVYLADFASYKPVWLPADNPVSSLHHATVCSISAWTFFPQHAEHNYESHRPMVNVRSNNMSLH